MKALMLILLFFGVTYLAPAQEQKLVVAEDAYIVQSEPDTNYGAEPVVVAFSRFPTGEDGRKGYIKFDASGIDGRITDVDLLSTYAAKRDRSVTLYVLEGPAADEWSEQEITWNNAPANDPDSSYLLRESEGIRMVEMGTLSGKGHYQPPVFQFKNERGKEALLYTLNQGNRTATLVMVQKLRANNNVSGVISKEEKKHMPPTLKITLEK